MSEQRSTRGSTTFGTNASGACRPPPCVCVVRARPIGGLVGVDNLGTNIYSIAWLSFPWTTSWGGCCGGFLGTRRAFPVGGLQVGQRGQGRVNPGETRLPAYTGELVLRKTSVLLLVLGFSCARVVSRASEGMREPRSTTFFCLRSSPRC